MAEGEQEIPDFLTVEEAGRVLRIGRTAAYQLANLYLETGGRDGIPAIRMGRQLRIPAGRLEDLAGRPLSAPRGKLAVAATVAVPAPHARLKRRSSTKRGDDPARPTLFSVVDAG